MGSYIGIDGKAREIKGVYVGVDSKARKVSKGYVGVEGVAHEILLRKEQLILKRLSLTPLDAARENLAGCHIDDAYTLFGGGGAFFVKETTPYVDYGPLADVDAYSQALVHTSVSPLSLTANSLAGGSCGKYGLFGGGFIDFGSFLATDFVDAYSVDLVKTSISPLSAQKGDCTAATIYGYCLFAGGVDPIVPEHYYTSVDAYNSELVQTTFEGLQEGRAGLASYGARSFIEDYGAFFGGGKNSKGFSNLVDFIDTSLVSTYAPPLSVGRGGLACAPLGDSLVMLFGGGALGSDPPSSAVDAFNINLIQWTGPSLWEAREGLAGGNVVNVTASTSGALFVGGLNAGHPSDTADFYDLELVHGIAPALQEARGYLAVAPIFRASDDVSPLFGGGAPRNPAVDAYIAE